MTFANYIQNFIQHPVVKVNSTCTGNVLESSMHISTKQQDRLTTYHLCCIRQILKKKCEYSEAAR